MSNNTFSFKYSVVSDRAVFDTARLKIKDILLTVPNDAYLRWLKVLSDFHFGRCTEPAEYSELVDDLLEYCFGEFIDFNPFTEIIDEYSETITVCNKNYHINTDAIFECLEDMLSNLYHRSEDEK